MGLHSSSNVERPDKDFVCLYLDVGKSCPHLLLLSSLYEYCKGCCCDYSAWLLLLVPPKGKSAIFPQLVGNRVDCSRSIGKQSATHEMF